MNGSIAQVLAVQSYNFIDQSSDGLGGSELRIRAASRYIKRGIIPRRCWVVWPQGYSKHSPQLPDKPGAPSLGDNMREWCLRDRTFNNTIQLVKPVSWGTRGDIIASYELIKEVGYNRAHFYFVTDPDHLRRVKLVWWLTHPLGWTASFLPAYEHRMSFTERYIREPVACVDYFVRLFPGREINPEYGSAVPSYY